MKERDVIQGLEELWGKAPLPADFREVISTPMTVGQNEDYEELEEFEDDKEKEEIREIIQGLEELWGKAPLPTDFREVVSTPDWQQSSRRSQSGRVVSMADHRRKRELIQSGLSLGGILAACLVLILSWSLKGGELAQVTAGLETLEKLVEQQIKADIINMAEGRDIRGSNEHSRIAIKLRENIYENTVVKCEIEHYPNSIEYSAKNGGGNTMAFISYSIYDKSDNIEMCKTTEGNAALFVPPQLYDEIRTNAKTIDDGSVHIPLEERGA